MNPDLTFTRIPSLGRQYLRAAKKRETTFSRGACVPPLSAQIQGFSFPQKQLQAYLTVCDLPRGQEHLPVPAPHLLTTPLHLAILTHPQFPLPAMGLVHASNVIKEHRPVPCSAPMDVHCGVTETRWLENGVEVDVLTHIQVNGELAWEEVSTYFRRTSGSTSKKTTPEPIKPDVVWSLPSSLGRQYGAVSGDRNPIHLWPITARLFGFKRHIVHGMWTVAKCVASMNAHHMQSPKTLAVRFKRPCFLPCQVGFKQEQKEDTVSFQAFRPEDGKVYLEGSLSPEDPSG